MGTKIKLTQYRPAFITQDVEPRVDIIESYCDLLKLEWVSNWTVRCKNRVFNKFSIQSNYAPGCHLLMAEFNDGSSWTVIGMTNRKCKFLPEFKGLREIK